MINTSQCEYEDPVCPCLGEIKIRRSMTAYPFKGIINSPEDPNRDFMACEIHYLDYFTFWKEKWSEYYSGVL